MFKLDGSRAEAERLAKQHPEDYQAGSTAWVTARFSAQRPMPKRLWAKWLDESYALSVDAQNKKSAKKKSSKRE